MTLSQICRSSYQNPFSFPGGEISDELRRKFDQWWSNQLSPQASMTPKMLPFMGAPSAVPNEMDFKVGSAAVAAAAAAAAAAQAGLSGSGSNVSGGSISASRESLLLNDSHSANSHHAAAAAAGMMVHPAIHASMHHAAHHHASSQYPNQKTRMRTSFDPEMELPKLQKWFQENPHPSRQQIQTYVVQLNALDSRRGRKPLDVNNVVYWFKNARAAQKRAEMRGGMGPMGALGHVAMNGYLSQHAHQLGQNSGGSSAGSLSGSTQGMSGMGLGNLSMSQDYLKSPLSLKSEDIDTLSQHSDDMDDEQSRSGSPQLPLSLTIHERHRMSPVVSDDEDDEDKEQDNHKAEAIAKDKPLDNNKQDSEGRTENGDSSEKVNRSRSHSPEDMNKLNKSEDLEETNASRSHQDSDAANNNSSPSSHNNNNSTNNHSLDASTPNHVQQSSSHSSPKNATTPKIEEPDDDLDMDEDEDDNENDTSNLEDFRSPSPDMSSLTPRKDLAFPMVPNPMFQQSFMYMSHWPGFGQAAAAGHPHAHHAAAAAAAAAGMQQNPLMAGHGGLNLSNMSSDERRKRNRTFIDPVTEVPKLEQWFAMNTHPSHNLILKYTEDLNTMPYR